LALEHRGPDDHGVFVDEAAGYAAAFRRLSIMDLSAHGHQPMVSRDGRWVVVFNGEIYFLEEARAAVEAAGGGPWTGHSDTEVLVEAIARWGVRGALERLEGMILDAMNEGREGEPLREITEYHLRRVLSAKAGAQGPVAAEIADELARLARRLRGAP
jgi:asparagine synthase (glutamine-hydrolysing)